MDFLLELAFLFPWFFYFFHLFDWTVWLGSSTPLLLSNLCWIGCHPLSLTLSLALSLSCASKISKSSANELSLLFHTFSLSTTNNNNDIKSAYHPKIPTYWRFYPTLWYEESLPKEKTSSEPYTWYEEKKRGLFRPGLPLFGWRWSSILNKTKDGEKRTRQPLASFATMSSIFNMKWLTFNLTNYSLSDVDLLAGLEDTFIVLWLLLDDGSTLSDHFSCWFHPKRWPIWALISETILEAHHKSYFLLFKKTTIISFAVISDVAKQEKKQTNKKRNTKKFFEWLEAYWLIWS